MIRIINIMISESVSYTLKFNKSIMAKIETS